MATEIDTRVAAIPDSPSVLRQEKSNPIRIAIVDDDWEHAWGLRSAIKTDSLLTLTRLHDDKEKALAELRRMHPEIVVVDPEAFGGAALQILLQLMKKVRPVVLIWSKSTNYCVRAFELGVCDYILKSAPQERLVEGLCQAKRKLETRRQQHRSTEARLAIRKALELRDFIAIKANGRVHFAHMRDIELIEAYKNYVKIHADNRTITSRMTMTQCIAKFPPPSFVRIHRKYVVNVNSIREYLMDGYRVFLASGRSLPCGRSFQHALTALEHMISPAAFEA